MKIPPRQADAFIANPSDGMVGALLFGPDTGLVRDRALKLIARITGISPGDAASDPFAVVRLSGADLKADPARLADERLALSLGGGPRAVRVEDLTDASTPMVENALEGPVDGNFLVLEAGELSPRSKLRKMAEASKRLACIACYADDARSVGDVIRGAASERGLDLQQEALSYLTANLGGDRMITRQELEKLFTYMGDEKQITLDHAMACIGDNAAHSLNQLLLAMAAGEARHVMDELRDAWAEGTQPVGILRAAQRLFHRLHLASAARDRGLGAAGAVDQLRPPVIFKDKPLYVKALGRWRTPTLARALDLLLEAEQDCKDSQLPAAATCERALIRLAKAG